jgi:hypothetical protein
LHLRHRRLHIAFVRLRNLKACWLRHVDEETKAEAKARENLEKAKAREDERFRQNQCKLAANTKAKIEQAIAGIEITMDMDLFSQLPDCIKNPVTAALAEYRDLDAKCDGILANGKGEVPVSGAALSSKLTASRKAEALARKVLGQLALAK